MKKIFLTTGFFIIIGIFFISAPSAMASCAWRDKLTTTNPETGAPTASGGCYQGEILIKNNFTDTCTEKKPNNKSSLFSKTEYLCCCSTDTVANDTKTTLFKAPDLLIKIPGMKPLENITCPVAGQCEISWIGTYVSALYDYGLAIAGILAALMLMAAGVLWLISAGDASKVTQAKELITGSITGLIILAASYVILIQVNPGLVNFKSIDVTTIKRMDLEPISIDGNPANSTICYNCVSLNSKISYKNGNLVNSDLNNKLTIAQSNSANLNWRVTEAYPPSSEHNSKCHNNGMCVDIALTSNTDCNSVNKLISILTNAGLSALNEYTDCAGTKTTYATSGHIHVK